MEQQAYAFKSHIWGVCQTRYVSKFRVSCPHLFCPIHSTLPGPLVAGYSGTLSLCCLLALIHPTSSKLKPGFCCIYRTQSLQHPIVWPVDSRKTPLQSLSVYLPLPPPGWCQFTTWMMKSPMIYSVSHSCCVLPHSSTHRPTHPSPARPSPRVKSVHFT